MLEVVKAVARPHRLIHPEVAAGAAIAPARRRPLLGSQVYSAPGAVVVVVLGRRAVVLVLQELYALDMLYKGD